jgi:DNA repair exonuclease SbcCD ATPase subunit
MADQSTQSTPPGPVTEEDLLRGIQIIQEGRRELQEQTRMSLEKRRELEARIKAMEEQLPILQKRVDETNACFAEVDKYLDQYIKTHKPEDAKVRGRALIEEYKRYFDNPGLPCPVDNNTPLSSLAQPSEEQLANASMHPEVKLAQAQTGAPLDTAVNAVREATRGAGIKVAA